MLQYICHSSLKKSLVAPHSSAMLIFPPLFWIKDAQQWNISESGCISVHNANPTKTNQKLQLSQNYFGIASSPPYRYSTTVRQMFEYAFVMTRELFVLLVRV